MDAETQPANPPGFPVSIAAPVQLGAPSCGATHGVACWASADTDGVAHERAAAAQSRQSRAAIAASFARISCCTAAGGCVPSTTTTSSFVRNNSRIGSVFVW